MEYDVEREYGQWHIREKGQLTRGTTVTDVWMERMGFSQLSRTNIDAVIQATMAAGAEQVLDPYAASHMPKDIAFKPSSRSYRSIG